MPHVDLPFPLLPVCVDTPRDQDVTVPFTIKMCNDCGLIMLHDAVDPQILYEIFHSDGLGSTWDAHYEEFARLIRTHYSGGRILEIGSGQGRLIAKLLPHYDSGVEVIDPMYEGPLEGVTVHDSLLTTDLAQHMSGKFDAVVSSHTLEHFLEYNEYFRNAWTCLKDSGLLFTSVPNMEHSFARGYGNQLNFEHPAVCLNVHWMFLHYSNGFVIDEINYFRNHSFQVVARKVALPIPFSLHAAPYARAILETYATSIAERIATVRSRAKGDKENWLFGASNLSQPLFMYGLEESHFAGVLDNSMHKHDKRLYGTGLMCRKPEAVVGKRPVRVFLNAAHYNEEVDAQLRALDSAVETVFL